MRMYVESLFCCGVGVIACFSAYVYFKCLEVFLGYPKGGGCAQIDRYFL